MSAETRKIPEPIIAPTTTMTASKRPMDRTNPSSSTRCSVALPFTTSPLPVEANAETGDAWRRDRARTQECRARGDGDRLLGIGVEDVVDVEEPRQRPAGERDLLLRTEVEDGDRRCAMEVGIFGANRRVPVVQTRGEGPRVLCARLAAHDRNQPQVPRQFEGVERLGLPLSRLDPIALDTNQRIGCLG